MKVLLFLSESRVILWWNSGFFCTWKYYWPKWQYCRLGWKCCFLYMKLLYSPDEGVVFPWWRCCFPQMKVLFCCFPQMVLFSPDGAVLLQWKCIFSLDKSVMCLDDIVVLQVLLPTGTHVSITLGDRPEDKYLSVWIQPSAADVQETEGWSNQDSFQSWTCTS